MSKTVFAQGTFNPKTAMERITRGICVFEECDRVRGYGDVFCIPHRAQVGKNFHLPWPPEIMKPRHLKDGLESPSELWPSLDRRGDDQERGSSMSAARRGTEEGKSTVNLPTEIGGMGFTVKKSPKGYFAVSLDTDESRGADLSLTELMPQAEKALAALVLRKEPWVARWESEREVRRAAVAATITGKPAMTFGVEFTGSGGVDLMAEVLEGVTASMRGRLAEGLGVSEDGLAATLYKLLNKKNPELFESIVIHEVSKSEWSHSVGGVKAEIASLEKRVAKEEAASHTARAEAIVEAINTTVGVAATKKRPAPSFTMDDPFAGDDEDEDAEDSEIAFESDDEGGETEDDTEVDEDNEDEEEEEQPRKKRKYTRRAPKAPAKRSPKKQAAKAPAKRSPKVAPAKKPAGRTKKAAPLAFPKPTPRKKKGRGGRRT